MTTSSTVNHQLLQQLELLIRKTIGVTTTNLKEASVSQSLLLPTSLSYLQKTNLATKEIRIQLSSYKENYKENYFIFSLQIGNTYLNIYNKESNPTWSQQIYHFPDSEPEVTYSAKDIPLEELFDKLKQQLLEKE